MTVVMCGTIMLVTRGCQSVRDTRSSTHQTVQRRGRLRIRGLMLSGYLSAVGRRAVCCPGQVGRVVSELGAHRTKRGRTIRMRAVNRLVDCCGSVFALLDSYTTHRLRRVAFHENIIGTNRLTSCTTQCVGHTKGHVPRQMRLEARIRRISMLKSIVRLGFVLRGLVSRTLSCRISNILRLYVCGSGSFIQFSFHSAHHRGSRRRLGLLFCPRLSHVGRKRRKILANARCLVYGRIVHSRSRFTKEHNYHVGTRPTTRKKFAM